MNSQQVFPSKPIGYLFLIFPVLVVAYLPALQGYYLHTDDYFWSYWGNWNLSQVMNFMSPIGRPTAGLIYYVFSSIASFRDTAWFRLVAVLNLTVFAYLLFRWMLKWKVPTKLAFSLTICLLTLPVFQVFVSYISTVPHSLSVSLSLLALILSQRALENSSSRWLAIFILFMAFSTNQVGALFFVAALAIPLIKAPEATFLAQTRKLIRFHAVTLLLGMSVYYAAFRIYLRLIPAQNYGKYDVRNFVSNYGERVSWFVEHPLYEVANLWSVTPTSFIPKVICVFLLLCSVCMIGIGLKAKSKNHFLSAVSKLTTLILLFPVGFGISLVSAGPSPEYRTYAVISALLIFMLALVPDYLLEVFKCEKARKVFHHVVVAAAFYGLYMSQKTINDYFVFPDSLEFRMVKSAIRAHVGRNKPLNAVHVFIPLQTFAAPAERHDLGEPNLRHAPNIRPIVLAALHELGIKRPPERITFASDRKDPHWTELLPKGGSKVDFEVKTFPTDLTQLETAIVDLSEVKFN